MEKGNITDNCVKYCNRMQLSVSMENLAELNKCYFVFNMSKQKVEQMLLSNKCELLPPSGNWWKRVDGLPKELFCTGRAQRFELVHLDILWRLELKWCGSKWCAASLVRDMFVCFRVHFPLSVFALAIRRCCWGRKLCSSPTTWCRLALSLSIRGW